MTPIPLALRPFAQSVRFFVVSGQYDRSLFAGLVAISVLVKPGTSAARRSAIKRVVYDSLSPAMTRNLLGEIGVKCPKRAKVQLNVLVKTWQGNGERQ